MQDFIDTSDEGQRGAVAGAIGAVGFMFAMAVDLAITRQKTNDLRLLSGMVPGGGRLWPVIGSISHVANGVALGTLFSRVHQGLPGPTWMRGLIFGQVENLLLWPIIIVLDHIHPGMKRGDLEKYNRPGPFFIEVLRHAVFGAVMGAAYEFLTPKSK
ncbi:MAG: DUF6789 family protein [Nitrolancea sp.]